MLSIGVITRGKYGRRLLDTLSNKTDFCYLSTSIPQILPDFIDEPESFLDNLSLDAKVLSSELVITYSLHPDITPEIVRRAALSGAKAIIIPGGWSRAGDPGLLKDISKKYDIEVIVEDICCEIGKSENDSVNEFASILGRPLLEVQGEAGKIKDIKVIRGAPCGSTWWMAEQLLGVPISEAPARAGLLVQQYPCRAVRGTGGGIHRSAELHKKAIEDSIEDNSSP
ncbi:MAG: DUF166 domain-containing protein [ANME-2 cluster archaeon]|nr:DUF166 domain-containing protein [ANME-2 cluster archaeon]